MRHLLASLCLAGMAMLAQPATSAWAQAGVLLKTFPLKASKLLLDPARPQLYATLPEDNSLAVINTETNTVVATLPIGSGPVDMAITPDGTQLYVANSGSTTAGIGVMDLNTLTVLPSLPAPFAPVAIAAGLGNRLYLLGAGTMFEEGTDVTQIDATTGAVQGTFGAQGYYTAGSLAITPDYKTLFFSSGGNLTSFDVSTATPVLLQESQAGAFGGGYSLSHNGQFLAISGETTTALVPASNLNATIATFSIGSYPGLPAFSADDSKLYEVQSVGGSSVVKVFSTATFNQLDSFGLSTTDPATGETANVTSMVSTAPGGYLYVAEQILDSDSYTDLALISTQAAPFFDGSVALSDGFYYLTFPDGNLFGYYNFNSSPYLFHIDLGFEYPIDAADGSGGVYLYDFTSSTFFYTSASLFPYLYDFTLDSFLYYFPNTRIAGHYTAYPRYFYNFAAGQIISK